MKTAKEIKSVLYDLQFRFETYIQGHKQTIEKNDLTGKDVTLLRWNAPAIVLGKVCVIRGAEITPLDGRKPHSYCIMLVSTNEKYLVSRQDFRVIQPGYKPGDLVDLKVDVRLEQFSLTKGTTCQVIKKEDFGCYRVQVFFGMNTTFIVRKKDIAPSIITCW